MKSGLIAILVLTLAAAAPAYAKDDPQIAAIEGCWALQFDPKSPPTMRLDLKPGLRTYAIEGLIVRKEAGANDAKVRLIFARDGQTLQIYREEMPARPMDNFLRKPPPKVATDQFRAPTKLIAYEALVDGGWIVVATARNQLSIFTVDAQGLGGPTLFLGERVRC